MRLRISLLLAVLGLASGATRAGGGEPANSPVAGFERFAGLAGEWEGTSTKGWRGANPLPGHREGLRRSRDFAGRPSRRDDGHPLFARQGEDFELRHYCVAGNQPHLRATEFEEEGRRVTFTFVDGGNLASRDRGHMDKAVFLFEDADHVTSRWTWYQEGKERWLEEIRLVRKP